MKAKTKFQKKIMDLSSKLGSISPRQHEWAVKNCASDYAVICRKTTFCLKCGHSWKEKTNLAILLETCECPSCRHTLRYHQNHSLSKESTYFAVLTTRSKHQVIRMFLFNQYFKKRHKEAFYITEVMQHWISPEGKTETLSKPVNNMSQYYDLWVSGPMEPRTCSTSHNIRCGISPYKIYPGRRILSIIKRNGFKGYFHDIPPQKLFTLLLTKPKAETLFKSGQYGLFRSLESYQHHESMDKYWKNICICIRHGYVIKDASIWFDYLELLQYFRKDLNNPFYICPSDLHKEHDRLSEKKTRIIERKKIKVSQMQYQTEKHCFLDLEFKHGNITIRPLQSIEEFRQEARSLKHCVYSNGYYAKESSLILSAKINNTPVETVEVCLKDQRVLQSRGLGNKATEHHDTIVDIVQSNMKQISKAMAG